MKLEDCDLNVSGVVTRPFVLARPEEEWEAAQEKGLIPESLYRFYCVAQFFSLESAPSFLRDSDRILFPYLKNVVAGIRDSFQELPDLLAEIRSAHADEYSPIKEARSIPWDPKAIDRSRRAFKNLVVELGGLLDQFSEVAAQFFHGCDRNFVLGRASFSALKKLVEAASASVGIVDPRRAQLEALLEALRREIVCSGPEAGWLDLFYLFRNKLAHIGNLTFHAVGLPGSGDSVDVYTFLPNSWPRMVEQYMNPDPPGANPNPDALREWLVSAVIHQDLVEYSEALARRIKRLVGAGFGVLVETYRLFQNLEPDAEALGSLKSEQSRIYPFRYFES